MLFNCLALSFILIQINYEHVSAKLYYIEVKYPLQKEPATSVYGSVWPMPQFLNETSKALSYLTKNDFRIVTNLEKSCDIIEENIKLYRNILFPPLITIKSDLNQTEKLLVELKIELASQECPQYPNSNMDESYELKILSGIAILKANSVWGALRGLDTFSQLTFITDDQKLAMRDSTHIKDAPRFTYRGLLIDTARHFIPVSILKKQLDAMSYNKFNVLHWHIVDDQSFPFESKKYPNLTKNGQYTNAHVYTQVEIKEVIGHARLRGIRVIPEFDSPGHVESFSRSFPQFITTCWNDGKPFQAIYSIQGKAEILNPTLEELYPVLKDVLNEIKEAFQDEYIHLGNDEVYYDCWKSNPNISEWMSKMNFTEYNQLEAYYTNRLLNITKSLNKKVTVWQDVYDNGVVMDKSTQVQIWKDTTTLPYHKKWYEYLNNITADGYPAILSSPWYINFVSYGYQEWYKYYQVEPMANFTGNAEQAKLLIGGEACLWSEYVDGTNLATRLWPRASAIAERLWSPASVNDPEEAKFRLDEHRCRLLRRGIAAAPVLNGFCGDYEYGMKKSVIYDPVFNYGWPNTSSASMSLRTKINMIFSITTLAIVAIFY